MKSPSENQFIIIMFFLIFILGIGLRVIQYPNIPPGFNQDEANSAYESFSLLLTGKDKWGNAFPAYFPSWGSGQNVLLAYLSIPFVKIFGLNVFSARFVPMLLGILSLIPMFFTFRHLSKVTGLFAMLILATVPWHFMLSRWALESNLAPFFMLLGIWLTAKSMINPKSKLVYFCLIPFSLSLYAYGTTAIILPTFFLLALLFDYHVIVKNLRSWLISFLSFLVCSFPFMIFFFENYVIKRNMSWTDHLFFATPLLPINRIDQLETEFSTSFYQNLDFIQNKFRDWSTFNVLGDFHLIFPGFLLLITLGLIVLIVNYIRHRLNRTTDDKVVFIVMSLIFAWFVSSLALIFLFTLNVNRFNHFFIPSIGLIVYLFYVILQKIKNKNLKKAFVIICFLTISINNYFPIKYYFSEYRQTEIKDNFHEGLDLAFAEVAQLDVEQILITDKIALPYVYTLFYLSYPPNEFQTKAQYEIVHGVFQVNSFGRYYFNSEYLDKDKPYGYLFRKMHDEGLQLRPKHVSFGSEYWEVGIIGQEKLNK